MSKQIALSCVSVMWGLLPLPEEHVDEWLESAAADYENIATLCGYG